MSEAKEQTKQLEQENARFQRRLAEIKNSMPEESLEQVDAKHRAVAELYMEFGGDKAVAAEHRSTMERLVEDDARKEREFQAKKKELVENVEQLNTRLQELQAQAQKEEAELAAVNAAEA